MNEQWPELPLAAWQKTYDTLHLWTQVIGKIRLARTPLINHWWNTTLYVNARGLTTSSIPYGDGAFEIAFDFIDHRLLIETSWGKRRTLDLRPQACADFWHAVMEALAELKIDLEIHPLSSELPQNVRLDLDREHDSYEPQWANRWWLVTLAVHNVLQEFRTRFIGKCSPVHFFWGSFDLAVTRFSGRRAPQRDDPMMNEAYSHEVSSAGFWPGSGSISKPAFYAYHAPQPEGFDRASVKPPAAHYDPQLGEFILMYDDVRNSPSPRETLLEFLQSTYEAGANLAGWDRAELERR
jgi:Family of unknown function (DUF5996)